jgi:hypothetical protein
MQVSYVSHDPVRAIRKIVLRYLDYGDTIRRSRPELVHSFFAAFTSGEIGTSRTSSSIDRRGSVHDVLIGGTTQRNTALMRRNAAEAKIKGH